MEEAARLRDEMHAVTTRIERVLASPGARLGDMAIEVPTACARGASAELVLSLLGLAAERFAGLVESLQVDEWHFVGTFDSGTVSVYELACMPLHSTRRHLARRGRRTENREALSVGRIA